MYPKPLFYKHKGAKTRQQSSLTKKPSHPEIETRSNSAYKSVRLCWRWHLDVGLFTFNPAWGHAVGGYGKLTEAVNSSDGESGTGDVQAATKLAGKNQNGRSLDLTMRRLNAASEESWCKAFLSKCPCGVGRTHKLALPRRATLFTLD